MKNNNFDSHKKLPNVFNVEQLKKMFSVVDKPKYMVIYLIGFFCGLRISEVCKLRAEDIDLERRVLKVVKGKFSKDRYVAIPFPIIKILKKWIEYIGDSEYLFSTTSHANPHITDSTIHKKLEYDLKRANLFIPDFKDKAGFTRKRFHFHTLRHSYATYLYEKGMDLMMIKEQLGHESIQTTQIYTHISVEKKIKAVDDIFDKNSMKKILERKLSDNLNPLEVMNMRLAKGDLSADEYDKILSKLKFGNNADYIG